MDIEKAKKNYEGKDMQECFATLQLQFQTEISSVRKEMKEMKDKVTVLESFATNIDDSLKEVQEKLIPHVESKIKGETKERLKLECWGRKWNVVIRGIEGTMKERGRETEKKVRDFIISTLKMDDNFARTVPLQAVHRLPGGGENKKNIIVCFVSLLDREDVIEAARLLQRGCGYSVTPDLPPESSELRKKLLYKLRQMSESERRRHKLIYRKEYPFVALIRKDRN